MTKAQPRAIVLDTMHIDFSLRRWFITGGLALLAGWWSTGCVHVEQTIRLKADGSGVLALRYGMSVKDLAEMEAMAQAQLAEGEPGEESPANPLEFDEAQVRKDFEEYAKLGVTLEDIRTEVVDGWKYLSLRVAFTSLDGLGQTEFLSDRLVTLKRLADGNYEFIQATPPSPAMETVEGIEEMMANMMKGFRAVLKVEVPGELVEANADRTEGRLAEWTFDVDKDAGALKRAQKMALRVVFKGDGLNMPDYTGQPVAE